MFDKLYSNWVFFAIIIVSLINYQQTPSMAIIIFIVFMFRNLYRQDYSLIWVLLCLIIIMSGRYYALYQEQVKIQDIHISKTDKVILLTNPLQLQMNEYGISGVGEVQCGEQRFNVRYQIDSDDKLIEEMIQHKLILSVRGELEPIETARNFHVFDYHQYSMNEHIFWQFKVTSLEEIRQDLNSSHFVFDIRTRILNYFRQYDHLSWVSLHNILLLNLSNSYYKEIKGNLVELGIVHMFAISGFHIQWIIRGLNYLLRRIGLEIEEIPKVISLCIIFYGYLIAWPVGAIRAIAYYIAKQLQERYQLIVSDIDLLAIIALVMILIDPLVACKMGFIFSFMMTLLIKLCLPRLKEKRFCNLYLTLICLLFSWPLSIQMNFTWNFWQLAAVFVISIIFERIFMPLMLLTNLSLLIFPKIFISLINVLQSLEIFSYFKSCFRIFQTATFVVGHLSSIWIFILFTTAIVFVTELLKEKRKIYALLVIVYGILMIRPYIPRIFPSMLIVDVGQGDALIYQPALSNQTWLIDTGGRAIYNDDGLQLDLEYGNKNIIPVLKAEGIREIEGIIISHDDVDHIGNLQLILHSFNVHHLFVSQETLMGRYWQNYCRQMPRQTRVHSIQGTQKVKLLNEQLIIYKACQGKDIEANDLSLVVKFQLGKYNVINMGDLSVNGEQELLRRFSDIRADIIKLGHHGSKTSSSKVLLEQINPKLALISAGFHNRYGHPNREVMDRLLEEQISYLSTHEVGAIRIQSNLWNKLKIECQLPLKGENS